MEAEVVAQKRWAAFIIYRACAVKVTTNAWYAQSNCCFDLPPDKLIKVTGALTNQTDEHSAVLQTFSQVALYGLFAAPLTGRANPMSIEEIEIGVVTLLPCSHEVVVADIGVGVEGNVSLVSICQESLRKLGSVAEMATRQPH